MSESRVAVHGARASVVTGDATGNHDFIKGAFYSLMFGLLGWAILAAAVLEALRLM
jgi:hypothetical protein